MSSAPVGAKGRRLGGRRAVVTAAGRGIGRATAIAFAREGAATLATDIDEGALVDLRREIPGIEIQTLDVRDTSSIERVMGSPRPVDILFNCVGFVRGGTILDCSDDDWSESFDINVHSMVRTIRAVLPGMLERGSGSIINMSSVASSVTGVPNRCCYGTTKAAVIGLTKAVATDFVAQGIRCNAVCPGTVQTPSLDERIAAQGDAEATRAAFIARQPMGRLGHPEEIAALVVYLASAEASYTTGQIHIIDGGWTT